MDVAELRTLALFDGLDDEQLATLAGMSDELRFDVGNDLFQEGQPADVWWVLLDGSIALLRQTGAEETVLGAMTEAGQWAGGFQAWDEFGVYFASGRATQPGRALTLPADSLRALADTWFAFGVNFIEGLVNTVRRIEAGARSREALVALGTLAAGLAHEINNPASAATRAVDAMEGTSGALTDSLIGLARHPITAEQFIELDELRRELASSESALDGSAVAEREETLSDWLTDHDIDRDWVIAPPLAEAGADVAWCHRVARALDGGPVAAGLEWVASTITITDLISEVKESTRRISDLVAAVRSYSQLDRASLQTTDVIEGLESTLVMLAHKLEAGVRVVRDYGAVPHIEAMAGELNQVWTNLIDNATDAMAGTGTLTISAHVEPEGWVRVEIMDSGPGMPAEVRSHAFEPFFTTKDVGKGTGLGLDISRRIIVERHHGEISIESEPGATVLRVRLPPGAQRSG